MNIVYKNPGYDHSIDSISLFLTGNETPFWSEPIFHFYPLFEPGENSHCGLIKNRQSEIMKNRQQPRFVYQVFTV